jgi:uncharacterized protein (TIGR02145 family)
MKKFIFLSGFFLAAIGAGAQVTIGSGNVPSEWSLLDIDTSVQKKGLHLPRLTTGERDALTTTEKNLTEGLVIFNTETLCLEYWNTIEWVSLCEGDVPPEACTDCPKAGSITTFVNVMYDFQHQKLEAYGVAGATNHQWQASTTAGGEFQSIKGANAAFYTIPERFIEGSSFPNNTEILYFRCLMTNESGRRIKSPEFEMMFIHTEGAGYGETNGVKYLDVERGGGGKMRIALLNLGQNEGNDAGDLGDFYQWGRQADGHQKTVWSKNASHANQIEPMTGGAATSEIIAKGTVSVNDNGQIPSTDGTRFGKFITTTSADDWSTTATASNRWGNGSNPGDRRSDIPATAWTYLPNNPCPSGWSVPSRWNYWDIYQGDGSDVTISNSNSNFTGTVNTWHYRAPANSAYGATIITNTSGEKVFLLTAGTRSYLGTLVSGGTHGYYWTSTNINETSAHTLRYSNNNLSAGYDKSQYANGFSVRCVAE